MSRGMTLIEVLASLVLLSLLAGASAALLGDARRQLENAGPTMNLAVLDQVVEQILDDPSAFETPTSLEEWPRFLSVETERGTIEMVSTDTPNGRFKRIVFTLDTVEVVRWFLLPEDES